MDMNMRNMKVYLRCQQSLLYHKVLRTVLLSLSITTSAARMEGPMTIIHAMPLLLPKNCGWHLRKTVVSWL